MIMREQQLYNLILKETKKQIKLNEGLPRFLPPNAITKLGRKIFSFAKRVRSPEFRVRDLGVDPNFANIMSRRLKYLDESLDDILKRTVFKRESVDWELSTKSLKRNLEKTGREIDRKITNLNDEINIYRTADAAHPEIPKLQKHIDELDDMKGAIDDAVGVVQRGDPANIIDMANTMKSGKISHAGKRVGRKPAEPTTPRQPAGQPGAPVPVPAAPKKGWIPSPFTPWGAVGYAAVLTFSYHFGEVLKKAGYPLLAKAFNPLKWAELITEHGPQIAEAFMGFFGVVKAANAKQALKSVKERKAWIEELVLLKLIENNKDLSPPEGQKYTDKLEDIYLAANTLSVEEREAFLNQVDEVTKNIAVNREALEALADADNPVIDGIFHASMALYISKKVFTNSIGDKGKIRVEPHPKKGFTRSSNCDSIKRADVDLNKLEKSLPNDTDIRTFANYCDIVGYRIKAKDKVILVAYVMKGFTDQARQAGEKVRADLHANVKKD